MAAQPSISVSILGAAGLIGRKHLRYILQNDRTCVHSIVDPTAEGAKLAAEVGAPVFTSLQGLVDSFSTSKPRAAVIATPTHMHVVQTIELMKHDIHILIEKPVCDSVDSGEELLKAAASSGSGTVLVGYHKRFNPYIVALKSLLDSGKLGTIVAVQGTWAARKPDEYFSQTPWRKQRGSGGPILTNMSHEVDMLQYLFGSMTRVFMESGPRLRGHDVEETGAAVLKFASGTVGTFVFSDNASSPFTFEAATGENAELISYTGKEVYRIMGTKGSVELPSLKRYFYDGESAGHWSLPLSEDDTLSPNKHPERFENIEANAPFKKRLEHWVDVIENGVPVNCTLKDGVNVTRILNALSESEATGLPIAIDPVP